MIKKRILLMLLSVCMASIGITSVEFTLFVETIVI